VIGLAATDLVLAQPPFGDAQFDAIGPIAPAGAESTKAARSAEVGNLPKRPL
jgi:hypothetical protein